MALVPSFKTKGLVTHGLQANLGFARALTSHLRLRYLEQYHGKYPLAPWVFTFDLALLAIAVVLVSVNVYLFRILPPPSVDLRLTVAAPPLISAKPLALEAKIKNIGGSTKKNVRLTWLLPAGTEFVSADPTLGDDHDATFSSLAPGEERSARVVVRLLIPPGDALLRFRVSDDAGTSDGSTIRPVVASALEITSPVEALGYAPGAQVPIAIHNVSPEALEDVTLVINRERIVLGQLPSLDRRVLLVDAVERFHIEGQVRGREVARFDREYQQMPRAESPLITVSLKPSTGLQATAEVTSTVPVDLFVFHPLLSATGEPYRTFVATRGSQEYHFDLERADAEPNPPEWFVIPIWDTRGIRVLGPTVKAAVTTAFRATAHIRYYAASGDQIGIGPLPPEVGQETKYWVHAEVGPTTSDLKELSFRLKLAPGIAATGRHALADGGVLAIEGSDVLWTLPSLPKQGTGVSAAFEISFIPTEGMRGMTEPLVSFYTASAIETRSGITLSDRGGELTSDLLDDQKAYGKGRVQ